MKNLAVINTVGISSLAFEPVFSGNCAFSRVIEWAGGIPDSGGIVVLAQNGGSIASDAARILEKYKKSSENEKSEPYIKIIKKDSWNGMELVNALAEAAAFSDGSANNIHSLFYVWADTPLMDKVQTEKLWELHKKYFAEYTFADGFPYGLTPEIMSSGFPERLKALAAGIKAGNKAGNNDSIERNTIFEILRTDINSFDVETMLSPEDLRMERVSMTCDTRRNKNIMEKLYSAGAVDAESACRVIPENRFLLRDLPAYFPVQITSECPQSCSYCPYPVVKNSLMPAAGSAETPASGTTEIESKDKIKDRRGDSDSVFSADSEGRHISVEAFSEICDKIVSFAGDAVISLSLWGEPSMHPQIKELIKIALQTPARLKKALSDNGEQEPGGAKIGIGAEPGGAKDRIVAEVGVDAEERIGAEPGSAKDRIVAENRIGGKDNFSVKVLIETSALGWNKDDLEELSEFVSAENIKENLMWIVSLDAPDKSLYEKLRGEGFEEAETTAELILKLFGKNCWIQAVRMNENEDYLEAFFNKWDSAGAQVIIQKYDTFAAILPDRKPSDLSPYRRFPCWHLKRDMPVLLDGSVPFCRQSTDGSGILGNILSEDPVTIWERGGNLYNSHVNGEYPGICGKCDEYYTFNF